VRVIAGELKGQRLVAPRGWKVRPTSDRVREAVFSALGDRVADARVLDLYCGTGALAIEALSRGAAAAVLVDRDTRPALGNVQRLGLAERAELVRADVERWLRQVSPAPDAGRFDLVFVDAPYRLADSVARDLSTHLPHLLAAGGRAVIESGARGPLRIDSLEPLRQRRYGAADVSFYGEASE
jgi:16S rRNA (guanine966-N2)-methyltransferase